MKIDYSNFLKRYRTEETLPDRVQEMKSKVFDNLKEQDKGKAEVTCYTDGICAVRINGKFYGCFDTITGKWFSGYVGDEPST